MSLPDQAGAMDTLRQTWPPEWREDVGAFRFQGAPGAGKRVNAASALGSPSDKDVADGEAVFAQNEQTPLFVVQPDQKDFDTVLAARGYGVVDPTLLMARATRAAPFHSAPPDHEIDALFSHADVGAERRAVMGRVAGESAVLFEGTPAVPQGVVFVANGQNGAMFHALYVAPGARRAGVGRALVTGCLGWAHAARAPWLALAVVEANAPAIALYTSLGFHPVGRYWYRTRRG
ncbi:MAG: GNAT family N-acetyltransferase [Pseudomonadota bacterium]